jgi:hypothetical protein
MVTTESISWTAITGTWDCTVLLEAIATAGSLTTSVTRVTLGRSARLMAPLVSLIEGWTVITTPTGTVRISLLMLTTSSPSSRSMRSKNS